MQYDSHTGLSPGRPSGGMAAAFWTAVLVVLGMLAEHEVLATWWPAAMAALRTWR